MRVPAASFVVLGMLAFLPQASEAQPCQTHSLPELNTIDGTIANTDCVVTPVRNARGEYWNVFLNAGETAIITMNRVTMQDPYLYLLNPSATVVASNDDAVPPNRNARIQYVAAATGMHRVVATTFALQPTSDNGSYEIRLEITGHAACQVRNLPALTTMNATLDTTDCFIQPYRGARGEIWTIVATAGNPIVVNMNRFTLTDPYLFLLDASWQMLASNDDFMPPDRDARISVVAPYTGTYMVLATTFASADPGAYSIRLSMGPPTAVADAYAAAFATPLTIAAPGVLANDNSNGGGAMSAQLVTSTTHGSLSLAANGGFTYTPNAGFAGIDTFSYRAQAAGIGNLVTVTLTVAQPTTVQAPTNLYVSALSGNTVTFRFTATTLGPDATGFVLEGGLSPGEVLASIPTGSNAPIFTVVAPSGSFYVRMRATRGSEVSGTSNEIRIHVNVPAAPSAPDMFSGAVNGDALVLAWRNTFAGGAPTGLVLDVSGSTTAQIPLGVSERLAVGGVPAGTYTLRLRSLNPGGASPSSAPTTVTIPGPCSGPPAAPSNYLLYRLGTTVYVVWDPPASGPAASDYLLSVTGSFVASFATPFRSISGTVGPGSYTITVTATNACGSSAPTAAQTLVVP